MPRNLYPLILAVLLYFFAASVAATENKARLLVLSDSVSSLSAAPFLDVLEDPTRRLTLAEVMSPEYADKFVANTQKSPSFGRTHSAYWLRFDLVNQSHSKWYLLMDFMLGDELSLHIVPEQITTAHAQRMEHYRHPVWSLTLPPAQKLRIYIRATNGDSILNLPVELLSVDALLTRTSEDYKLYSTVYAAMLTLAVYNFFLFIILRESSYFTLSAHILTMVIGLHNFNPVFESLFFLGDTGAYFFTAPFFATLAFLGLFVRQVLQTKVYQPKLDVLLTGLTWLSALLILVAGLTAYGKAMPPVLGIIVILVTSIASFLRCKQGDRIARYFFWIFLISFSIMLPNIIISAFWENHWQSYNGLIMAVSNALFALFLSIVQAERVRLMRENMQRIKSAGEAKDSFLASMSHELRTPLNAIFGLSTLLQLSNLDDKQGNYVKKLEASSRYMLQLIGNILDIKKIENKSFQLENKPFVLKTVLTSIYDLLHGQATVKGLNLAVQGLDEVTETISGDRVRLSQVLINLLGNGIKYTQYGDVTLCVEKRNYPTAPEMLCLRFDIMDTGIGIAQDKMQVLFEPFVQLEPTIAYSQQGAGLGLAISKNLVEMMGGKLEVESALGKGSRFFFSLLFSVSNKAATADQDVAAPKAKLMLPGTRILLVDDYELNVFIWRKLISSIGGDVAIALDGHSTILQLQQSHFDVVLMDISLPDMDGFEVTRWIRQHSQHPDVPIIALTAHATVVIEQQCKAAGMNGFLAKPFELQDLYTVIYQAVYEKS